MEDEGWDITWSWLPRVGFIVIVISSTSSELSLESSAYDEECIPEYER